MADYDQNLLLDSEFTYQTYAPPPPPAPIPTVEGGTTVISTINGGGGQATGPSISFLGGASGYDFVASGNSITLTVANAATVRASIGAAASGANADLNTFSALTGSGGWAAWTGTPNKATHATFSGSASVGYVQAEMQAVMDGLKNVTEGFMALLATLLASGIIKV